MVELQQKSTALLLFTRSPQEEALVKDFSDVQSLRSNSIIALHLISNAEKTARSTGLPCFVINSSKQHGNTFGERLSDAFSQIFNLGYRQVIAIGNDCPTLSAKNLTQAAEQLSKNNAFLGPAADGGLYLIGLQKNAFFPQQFAELPWETENVNYMLQQYLLSNKINFLVGEEKTDIDFNYQLMPLLKNANLSFQLRSFIRSILDSIGVKINVLHQNLIIRNHRIYTSLRAPPEL